MISASSDITAESRVIDVFIFFNELDLLELRLRTLYDVVDYFVITECTETFSGKPKVMTFSENRARFQDFEDKIIYNPISPQDLEFLGDARWTDFRTDLNRSLPHKIDQQYLRECAFPIRNANNSFNFHLFYSNPSPMPIQFPISLKPLPHANPVSYQLNRR